MSSKIIYPLIAAIGIAAASGAAWWYQQPGRNLVGEKAPAVAPSAPTGVPVASAGGSAGGPPGGPRLVGVEVAKVTMISLRDDAQAVGTLRSRQNVMLRPEVAGRILTLGFTDGNRVRAGQVLVQLDDTLQRAEVQQSLAQVSIASANHKRNQELVAQNFVAQRVLDESSASLQVSQAQLALSCARLDRMRIVAPFAGTVGIRNVNIGDYVKDGADLINLEDIGTLYVDFRLPERNQGKVVPGLTVELDIDAIPGRKFNARVEAIDPLIDANGRSIGVRAVLANTFTDQPSSGKSATASKAPSPALTPLSPATVSTAMPSGCPPSNAPVARSTDGAASAGTGPLRPGMFARATTVFSFKPQALAVPEESIVPQGGKQYVLKLVDPSAVPNAGPLPPDTKLVSKRVEVSIGIRRPGQVEVLSGLDEGDTVVVAGQQRLQKDGTGVRVIEMGKAPVTPSGEKAIAPTGAKAPANSSAAPTEPVKPTAR